MKSSKIIECILNFGFILQILRKDESSHRCSVIFLDSTSGDQCWSRSTVLW